MNTIIVQRSKLIEIIEKNKISHQEKYNEAEKLYFEKKKSLLEKCLLAMENGKDPSLTELLNLTKPVSQVNEYEKIIRMLKLHIEENIDLDLHDYEKYVEDNWSWKAHFETTYSRLTNG